MTKVNVHLSGLLLCLSLSFMPLLLEATPTVSCGTTISSFPYTESFETGLGDWSNGGPNNLWQRDASGTTSGGTGPSSGDNGTTYYVYTEASTNNVGFPNKINSLVGPCFDLSGVSSADFDFSYHMYGTYMGDLSLQVSTNGGVNWTTLWTESGDQGNQWFQHSASLNSYVGQTIQLRFYGITGSSWSGDMAVDELSLTVGAPPTGLNCTTTINTFPYNESFEAGTGNWIEETSTNVWRRTSFTTGSGGTGPSSAADGTYYMYTEASSPNYPFVTEYFTGPCFDLNSATAAHFAFQYHMLGTSIGTLELEIQTDANPTWISIWNKSGEFGVVWTSAFVDLNNYVGQNIQLRFKGTTGSSYTGDIAIDDLRLETTSAPPVAGCGTPLVQFPYAESFEADFGGWVENGTPSLWSRTYLTSAPDGNYIILASGSPVVSTGGSSSLESPCYDLSSAYSANCSFSYFRQWSSSSVSASLSLQISTDGGSTWNSLWNVNGNGGFLWYTASIDLSPYIGQTIQLRFKGEFGPNSSSANLWVDNFQLYAPNSPSVGNVSGQILFAQTNSCPDPTSVYCCDPQSLSGVAMPNVGINVTKGGNTTATISDGTGTFAGNFAAGNVRLETVANTSNWSNGISISDVIAVNNHASGSKLINCPIQRLAADVDGDGDIDATDATLINDMNLGNIITFPGGKNWKFVPNRLIMPGDLQPDKRFYADFWNSSKTDASGSYYPFKATVRQVDGTTITYSDSEPWYNGHNTYLTTNCNTVDFGFYGVKVGDINSSATHNTFDPPYASRAVGSNPNTIRAQAIRNQEEVIQLRSGSRKKYKYEVKIKASVSESIVGYQFGISFDDENVDLEKIKPNKTELNQSLEKNFGQAKKTLRGGTFATQWVTDFSREALGKDLNSIVLLSFEFKSDLEQHLVERAFNLDGAVKEIQFYSKDGLIEDIDLQLFIEPIK